MAYSAADAAASSGFCFYSAAVETAIPSAVMTDAATLAV